VYHGVPEECRGQTGRVSYGFPMIFLSVSWITVSMFFSNVFPMYLPGHSSHCFSHGVSTFFHGFPMFSHMFPWFSFVFPHFSRFCPNDISRTSPAACPWHVRRWHCSTAKKKPWRRPRRKRRRRRRAAAGAKRRRPLGRGWAASKMFIKWIIYDYIINGFI